jgi:hypothetical protein
MLVILIIIVSLIFIYLLVEKIKKYIPLCITLFLNELILHTFLYPTIDIIVQQYRDFSFSSKEEFYEIMQELLYKEVNYLAVQAIFYSANKTKDINLWNIIANIIQILIWMVAIQKTNINDYPFTIKIIRSDLD